MSKKNNIDIINQIQH